MEISWTWKKKSIRERCLAYHTQGELLKRMGLKGADYRYFGLTEGKYYKHRHLIYGKLQNIYGPEGLAQLQA